MTTTKNPTRQLARIVAVGLLSVSPALLGCGKQADIAEKAKREIRFQELDAKDQINSILLDFSMAIDDGDSTALSALGPDLDPNFTLDVTDFLGADYHFEGLQGLVLGFGPIMTAAQANVLTGAIAVDLDLDGNSAKAYFKHVGSVKPPQELGVDVDVKVLVLVDITATLVRGKDGKWKLRSIKATKELAYPGSVELIGE